MRGFDPDPRDDVHALGVIWFQLLMCDIQRGVGADFDEDLRELGVVEETIQTIKKCVAGRQDRRFQDAQELAERLEEDAERQRLEKEEAQRQEQEETEQRQREEDVERQRAEEIRCHAEREREQQAARVREQEKQEREQKKAEDADRLWREEQESILESSELEGDRDLRIVKQQQAGIGLDLEGHLLSPGDRDLLVVKQQQEEEAERQREEKIQRNAEQHQEKAALAREREKQEEQRLQEQKKAEELWLQEDADRRIRETQEEVQRQREIAEAEKEQLYGQNAELKRKRREQGPKSKVLWKTQNSINVGILACLVGILFIGYGVWWAAHGNGGDKTKGMDGSKMSHGDGGDKINGIDGSKVSNKIDPSYENSIGMEFVWIPPGNFMMGSANEEKKVDNETQHKVTLTKGFYMGVYTVTQEQWYEVMGNNPSSFKGEKNLPVQMISWDDCQAFIKKLRENDKKPYRLPTEAEWEYACRAGTTTPFYFGDTISTDQANYGIRPEEKTTPVGTFPKNALGLHDMHGNVYQWCQDWYGDYPQNDVIDPQGPEKGIIYRVLRGGSWLSDPGNCRSASRFWSVPGNRRDYCGFRVAFFLD